MKINSNMKIIKIGIGNKNNKIKIKIDMKIVKRKRILEKNNIEKKLYNNKKWRIN